jgi:hypothetical protein
MASAVVNALSMAVGKAAGNGSVSSVAEIASALRAHTLVSALGAGAWLMAKPLGLLVLLANLYLIWVHSIRHNRVKAIKKKYGYTKDPRSYQDMTIGIAQEVENNLAEWDMPWLFELGWLFNFLAVSEPLFSHHSYLLFSFLSSLYQHAYDVFHLPSFCRMPLLCPLASAHAPTHFPFQEDSHPASHSKQAIAFSGVLLITNSPY